jgi:hypothetical protein
LEALHLVIQIFDLLRVQFRLSTVSYGGTHAAVEIAPVCYEMNDDRGHGNSFEQFEEISFC